VTRWLAQEALHHWSMLLDLGADVAGSPAAEHLELHARQYLKVVR